LVDFDTNALVLREAGIKVVATSVDSVEDTASLAEGLRLGAVQMTAGVDVHEVAAATGAFIQDDTRTNLHATGFLLTPEGTVADACYSTGPIGRFTASDVFKKVAFAKLMIERAKQS